MRGTDSDVVDVSGLPTDGERDESELLNEEDRGVVLFSVLEWTGCTMAPYNAVFCTGGGDDPMLGATGAVEALPGITVFCTGGGDDALLGAVAREMGAIVQPVHSSTENSTMPLSSLFSNSD